LYFVGFTSFACRTFACTGSSDISSRTGQALVCSSSLGIFAFRANFTGLVGGIVLEGADLATFAAAFLSDGTFGALLALVARSTEEAFGVPLIRFRLIFLLLAIDTFTVFVGGVASKLFAQSTYFVINALLSVPSNGV